VIGSIVLGKNVDKRETVSNKTMEEMTQWRAT